MARIVITSWGSFGDVNPYLALGLGLRARGHDVVLCMPPYYEPVVRSAGLGFAPGAPDAVRTVFGVGNNCSSWAKRWSACPGVVLTAAGAVTGRRVTASNPARARGACFMSGF